MHQTRAPDQWAYYQAKDIRRKNYKLFPDDSSVFPVQNSEQAQKVREKYQKEVERYRDKEEDIAAEAISAENEVRREERRADRFDLGEVMLEAALVICSITLLPGKRIFRQAGLVLGAAAFAIAATGFLIH